MRYRICFALLLSASACSPLAPAAKPAQLQHTPGAYVTVRDSHFEAGIFELEYPSNWRVVKLSTADASYLRVAFVAPDQSAVTLTQVENSEENALRLDNGVALAVEIKAGDLPGESFFNAARRLVSSIRD